MKTDGKEYRGSTRRDNTWSIPPQHLKSLLFFVSLHSFARSFFFSLYLSLCLSIAGFSILSDFRRIFPRPGRGKQRVDNRVHQNLSYRIVRSCWFLPFAIILYPRLPTTLFRFLTRVSLTPLSSSLFLLSSSIYLRSRPKTRVLKIISGDPSTRVVA